MRKLVAQNSHWRLVTAVPRKHSMASCHQNIFFSFSIKRYGKYERLRFNLMLKNCTFIPSFIYGFLKMVAELPENKFTRSDSLKVMIVYDKCVHNLRRSTIYVLAKNKLPSCQSAHGGSKSK